MTTPTLGARSESSSGRGAVWRDRALLISGSLALHLAPLLILLFALPAKPLAVGGAFGQTVSITLVSGTPARPTAPAPAPVRPDLAALEQRLSDKSAVSAEPAAAQSAPSTRLSDLFDAKPGAAGAASASASLPSANSGTGDDPFSRASVSYRGDDPAKASRLGARVQRCAAGAGRMRLLLIINAEGYLIARPRPLDGGAPARRIEQVLQAIERCAPFTDAATPGAPRSYEVEIG